MPVWMVIFILWILKQEKPPEIRCILVLHLKEPVHWIREDIPSCMWEPVTTALTEKPEYLSSIFWMEALCILLATVIRFPCVVLSASLIHRRW